MNEVVSASATFLWYRQHQLKMLCNTAENCMPWLTWCLLLWNGWHPFDQEMSVIINSLWAGINTIDKAQHPCSVHVGYVPGQRHNLLQMCLNPSWVWAHLLHSLCIMSNCVTKCLIRHTCHAASQNSK